MKMINIHEKWLILNVNDECLYMYILSLICFVRMDFSDQYCIEDKN